MSFAIGDQVAIIPLGLTHGPIDPANVGSVEGQDARGRVAVRFPDGSIVPWPEAMLELVSASEIAPAAPVAPVTAPEPIIESSEVAALPEASDVPPAPKSRGFLGLSLGDGANASTR